MNNDQFRRLVGTNSPKPGVQGNGATTKSASAVSSGPSALGSRQRASIPMTPRSVAGGAHNDFARQMAARNQADRQQKKFKTSAPKGSRLAEGYVDRARAREGEKDGEGDEADEKTTRIRALEELLKKGEIDQATFDKQRDQIAGGDLSSTHLVKGLDFRLLERVRKGEDVYGNKRDGAGEDGEDAPVEDVDDAFDRLEEQEVQAVAKDGDDKREKKKGQLSSVALNPGKKRTRDQIIAEMKAARAAAKAQPSLGDRFNKIGAKQKAGTRIERDGKGREVMIIVDEDGHEKRKVRKVQPGQHQAEEEEARRREMMMPDKDAKPLGMEVPEAYRNMQQGVNEEEDNDDIFGNAGDDYDPLAGMESSDSDSDADPAVEAGQSEGKETEGQEEEAEPQRSTRPEDEAKEAMPPPPPPLPNTSQRHDYFKGSKTELLSERTHKAPSMSDPSLQAAFKKAAQLGAKDRRGGEGTDAGGDDDDIDEEEARRRAERRKQMLESARRDDEDLDMGFGTSRFEDEEDFDESQVKLSEWGDEDGDGESQGGRGKSKRKRGPKKKKGDVNSAADVLRVMEQRKAA